VNGKSIRNAEQLQAECNTKDTVFLSGKYKIDRTIHITKPTVITGNAQLTFEKNVEVGLFIESSDVVFKGLSFSTFDNKSDLLQAIGTAKKPLERIIIDSCCFDGGANSIKWDYVNDAIITYNRLKNIEYTGIGLYSCHNIIVTFNKIKNINLNHKNKYSYGVAVSFHFGDPKSTDICINDNYVENNPFWEALDTHGGENIEFCRNVVRNCWRGVAAVGDDYREIQLCKNVMIVGNDIECSDEALSNGIVFTGVGDGKLSDSITVKNNVIGKSVIGLYSNYTRNAFIDGNDIFASDEGWRDVGSFLYHFSNNKVKLSSKASTYYNKCGLYLKPTKGVRRNKAGLIINNSIISFDSPGILAAESFQNIQAEIRLIDNSISTKAEKYKGEKIKGENKSLTFFTEVREK
jgi:hypothetical protein